MGVSHCCQLSEALLCVICSQIKAAVLKGEVEQQPLLITLNLRAKQSLALVLLYSISCRGWQPILSVYSVEIVFI